MPRKPASKQTSKTVKSDVGEFWTAYQISALIEAAYNKAEGKVSYVDCCVEVSERINLDIEVLAKLITKALKAKMTAEASRNRTLKPQYRINTLPL